MAVGPPRSASAVKAIHYTSTRVSSVVARRVGAAGAIGSVSTTALLPSSTFRTEAVLQPLRFWACSWTAMRSP